MKFHASRPGAWLREDIADILTALAYGQHEPEYFQALYCAAQALGISVIVREQPSVEVGASR